MPDLDFTVKSVEAVPHAAAPLLHFKLHVSNANKDERIQTVALRCQINIEPNRRRYSEAEQKKMLDLFGEPERWGKTLTSMLWTHADTVIQPFSGETTVNLPVVCTFDFNIAATKYFAGLNGGEIPLLFLFSGTIFYENELGNVQIAQISWNKESTFRFPANVWQEMMEIYYPNGNWLRIQRDVFERLLEYKTKHGIPTWEQTLEKLLPEEEEVKETASGYAN